MKRIMLSVLMLCAVSAYSQEIRMPDEKRKEYVKDKPTQSDDTQLQRREEAARQRQIEAERKRASINRSTMNSGTKLFCMIRESSSTDSKKTSVQVITDEEFMRHAKKLNERYKEQSETLMIAMKEQDFRSGLDALNSFSQNGWNLVQSNVYTTKETVFHEYLMEYQLPR